VADTVIEADVLKQRLGFEDVATRGFDAVMSHVHWVYCTYILLHLSPPGVSAEVKSLGDTQRQLHTSLPTTKNVVCSRN
jgi:hypothetical protein